MGEAELEIARIVWNLGKATVRDVLENLPEDRRIDFKTVQTYLRRLEAKGYLKSQRDGRSNVYRTAASLDNQQNVQVNRIDKLLDVLFNGEMLPLVQHLVNKRGVTADEIQQMREFLDRLEGGAK